MTTVDPQAGALRVQLVHRREWGLSNARRLQLAYSSTSGR